jgi:hypothetical protein
MTESTISTTSFISAGSGTVNGRSNEAGEVHPLGAVESECGGTEPGNTIVQSIGLRVAVNNSGRRASVDAGIRDGATLNSDVWCKQLPPAQSAAMPVSR